MAIEKQKQMSFKEDLICYLFISFGGNILQ